MLRTATSRCLAALLTAAAVILVPTQVSAEVPPISVSAAWSAARVVYGDRVDVTGVVSPAGTHQVVLQRLDGGSPSTIEAVQSGPDGEYRMDVPSDRVGGSAYRVVVPGSEMLSNVVSVSSRQQEIEVVRDRSTTRTSWSARSARVNARVTVNGVVAGGAGGARRVFLQQRIGTGWRNVGTRLTNARGAYSMPLPTGWFYRSALRVYAPATATALPAVTDASVTTVRPGYRPAGSARSWSRLSDRYLFRFNPCRPVTYRLNLARAPRGAAADTRRALALLGQATGLRFRYRGTTSAIPGSRRAWPSDTTLVVAWATPGQTRWDLRGATVGRGGVLSSLAVAMPDGSRHYRTTRAGVVIDSTARLRGGFARGSLRGQVLMHELAHAAGISHTSGAHQIMRTPMSSRLPARWGAGDLAGLARVGMRVGCL